MYQPPVRTDEIIKESKSPFASHNGSQQYNSGLTRRMKMELASAINNNNNNNQQQQQQQPWQQNQRTRLSRNMPPQGPPAIQTTKIVNNGRGRGSSNNNLGDLGKRGQRPISPNALKLRRKMRKNNREKQRRMELNEKFEKLCSLLNLGKQTKTEKYTILSEAINLIGSLQAENAELRRERHNLRSRLDGLTSSLQDVFPPQPDGLDNVNHNKLDVVLGKDGDNLDVKLFDFGPMQYPEPQRSTNMTDESPFRTGNNPFNHHPNSGISPSKFGLFASSFTKRSPSPFGFPPNQKSPGIPFQNMRSPIQLNQQLVNQVNALSPGQDIMMDTEFTMVDDNSYPFV